MHHFDSKPLPYSCTQLLALVADIERYPAFLPGWSSVRILHSGKSQLQVEQQPRPGPLEKILGQSSSQLLRLFENRARSLYSRA
jgi:hypothetical protein